MEPGEGEIDADTILGVDFLGRIVGFEGLDGALGVFTAAGEFGFDDLVARDLSDELADGEVGGGHELKDVGDGDKAVAAGNDAGVDDAAVAFAADDRAVGEHGLNDVGFADGSAEDAAVVCGGDVVEHSAGGEVGDGKAGAAGENPFGTKSEGIFLADVSAVFIDDGEAVGIGVLSEADGGVVAANLVGQGNQILLGRFGVVRESAVGGGIQMNELAAEFAEERGGGDATGAVDAVEDDFVTTG